MAATKRKLRFSPNAEVVDFEVARQRLYNEIVALRDAWDQYLNLFACDQETVDVLNACASWFFGLAQRAILREVLLGISRLTDELEQGKHINLSLSYLLLDPQISNDSEARRSVADAIQKAEALARVPKQHRHKYIAHFDALIATTREAEVLPPLMQQEIEGAISAIEDAYQLYSSRFRSPHVVFSTGRSQSSSRLVEILRGSDRWADVREARERTGRSKSQS